MEKEKRMEWFALLGDKPIPSNTWEGSSAPDEQADPCEAIILVDRVQSGAILRPSLQMQYLMYWHMRAPLPLIKQVGNTLRRLFSK